MDTLPALPPAVANALAWASVAGAGTSIASSVTSAVIIRRKREGLDVPQWLSVLDSVLAVLSINLGRTLAGKKPSP